MTKKQNTRGKFIRVSKDLLNELDFNSLYETQLALTILYKVLPAYKCWEDTYLDTTPSLLIKMFGTYDDINQRQQKNVVEALIKLRDKGIISFKGETIKFKDEILINAERLIELSESGKTFVELLIQDFFSIMQVQEIKEKKNVNGVQSLLLQTFLVAKARWNFNNIDKLNEVEDFAYEVFQENGDEDIQQLKGVFCNDSYDFIRTHKHYDLDEVEAWACDDYVKCYLETLVELGCIKIKHRKVKTNGTWKTMSFYYTPDIDSEKIEAMIEQYVRRFRYASKEQEEQQSQTKTKKETKNSRQDRFRR